MKNPILREDQLPQKFLHPQNRKKPNKQGDVFFTSDNIFGHHRDKKAPFQPPIRKAAAFFSGKRNPNDNHFSRSKPK
ncbi:RNA-binding protein nob1 [Quillaja saponaria]|uniref:RNA-binding protein nob1 n=1 Tax=Quillaja saponaria TaxID=32244 RepID=A0AAD7KSC7_QUISA|nr:RNA-binding protein nob1 [Quillaja saponaria]